MQILKAGRELDILIAEMVFGYKVVVKDVLRFSEDGISGDWIEKDVPRMYYDLTPDLEHAPWTGTLPEGDYGDSDIPKYSTDIKDAWTVVEDILKNNPLVCFNLENYSKDGKPLNHREYQEGFLVTFHENDFNLFAEAWAETPAEAICLAALKAVGWQDNIRG